AHQLRHFAGAAARRAGLSASQFAGAGAFGQTASPLCEVPAGTSSPGFMPPTAPGLFCFFMLLSASPPERGAQSAFPTPGQAPQARSVTSPAPSPAWLSALASPAGEASAPAGI